MNAPLSAAALARVTPRRADPATDKSTPTDVKSADAKTPSAKAATKPVDAAKKTAQLDSVRAGAETLKHGSKGEKVAQAQTLLNDVGGAKLTADGKFGAQTESAVKSFQNQQKLKKIDGKIGPETMGALDALKAKQDAASAVPEKKAVCQDTQAMKRETAAAKDTLRKGELTQPEKAQDTPAVQTGIAAKKKTDDATAKEATKKPEEQGLAADLADVASDVATAASDALDTITGAITGAVKGAIQGAIDGANGGKQPAETAKAGATPAALENAAPAKDAGKVAANPKTEATAPKPDAAPYIGETLRNGARGSDVENVQNRLKELGYDFGSVDGKYGPKTNAAITKFQKDNNLAVDGVVGKETYTALKLATPKTESTTDGTGVAPGAVSNAFKANETALAKAARSSKGKLLNSRVGKFAEDYNKAAKLTGVPAAMIAAIHGQESGWGTHRQSTQGPESGFGLDPRYVSNKYGNAQLAKHGLGTWQRGKDNSTNRLQSAVIAAEHFKRNAKSAGVKVGPNMSKRDILLSTTAYIAGPNSKITKRASSSGKSFVFNPADSNPHVYHPGGTSIGKNGQKIRVPPGRKQGLLRWDVMLPMIDRRLGNK